MNQEKIGLFIGECRKNSNLTQSKLAEKLGVSNRAVSKWENGLCMPDYSLFKPLCEILNITINELLNGEKSEKNISDENIINTIKYAEDKRKTDIYGYIILSFLGITLIIFGWLFYKTPYFFSTLSIIVGNIFLIIGMLKLTKNINKKYKIIINIIYILLIILLIIFIDLINVRDDNRPRFYIYKKSAKTYEYYNSIFYKSYFCRINTDNEYMFSFFIKEDKMYETEINKCKIGK